MRYILAILVAFAVVFVLGLGLLLSGIYNVAATSKDVGFLTWALTESSEASVKAHAKGVHVPVLSQASVETGFRHYEDMCLPCHGAPGVEPDEMGKGLNPTPPDLQKVVREFNNAELYWVIKHGIKMTGMPAFGPTHSEDELWAMVSFVSKIPDLSPAQYQEFRQKYGTGEHEGEPEHGGYEKPRGPGPE